MSEKHPAMFTEAGAALAFITAGHAVVTLKSLASGRHLTYRVERSGDDNRKPTTFVSVLSAGDTEPEYHYIGVLDPSGEVRRTRASRRPAGHVSLKGFSWAMRHLLAGRIPAELEVWHEGACGRCGRALTDPESITSGIGPTCRQKQ